MQPCQIIARWAEVEQMDGTALVSMYDNVPVQMYGIMPVQKCGIYNEEQYSRHSTDHQRSRTFYCRVDIDARQANVTQALAT